MVLSLWGTSSLENHLHENPVARPSWWEMATAPSSLLVGDGNSTIVPPGGGWQQQHRPSWWGMVYETHFISSMNSKGCAVIPLVILHWLKNIALILADHGLLVLPSRSTRPSPVRLTWVILVCLWGQVSTAGLAFAGPEAQSSDKTAQSRSGKSVVPKVKHPEKSSDQAVKPRAEQAPDPKTAVKPPEESVAAQLRPIGPVHGESMSFHIHWMGIPSAMATMNFSDQKGGYEISATLRSIGAVDVFYPVDDRLHTEGRWENHEADPSHVDSSKTWLTSLNFLKDQNEGRKRRKTTYRFDRTDHKLHYFFSRENVREKELTFEDMLPTLNDPLSAFFSVRMRQDLQPNMAFTLPLVDGDKLYDAEISTGPVESLYTPLGWFEVLPVYPQLVVSELFRHKGKLTIWLTNDTRRLPVRVETTVKIGSVSADLIQYQDGRGGSAFLHNEGIK